jgi:hypothetical protein
MKGWRRKAVVGLIAFLLPTADGYLGRRYVEHLCAKDGGLQVYRVVKDVEGVLGLAPDSQTLKRTGYRFVEYPGSFSDPKRAIRRLELLPDGQFVETFDSRSIARYEVSTKHDLVRYVLIRFARTDDIVRDRETSEVIVRYRWYGGGAGWAERFLGHFTDAGGAGGVSCPPYQERPGGERIVLMVLKPAALAR